LAAVQCVRDERKVAGDDNRAKLAGNISNLLQTTIPTENRQLLFIE
jgi:hypothetical protein